MKIVLLGKNGQVGWELQRSLASLGEVIALGREAADLENPGRLQDVLRTIQPAIVVNAGAYTAVDRAETDIMRARLVNADAPAELAKYAAQTGTWLIHYSTDYVFDGTKTEPYLEDDLTAPLSVYGETKLAGERAILSSSCQHLIFRTSWVYASRGSNFVRTMLKLAAEREQLAVVNDQRGAPTSAELIADVTALCLYRIIGGKTPGPDSGIYHLVAAGEATWFDFARLVLSEAEALGVPLKVGAGAVRPIPASEYPTPARRPANSRLSTGKLREAFGLELPDWRVQVRRAVREMIER